MTITRFAPSPTGYIHVGNLRTALMNYLIARKNGGEFILRIDDTDPVRSKEEYVDGLKEDLTWLGLHWDRVERQSERLDKYHAAADELRKIGRFYEAWETPTELDLKRKKQLNMGKPPVYDRAALNLSEAEKAKLRDERGPGVWRFKLDQERIEWKDGILGDISIDAASVSDPVLIRGDGQILYTLASVVDDTEMGVTNVVRGSDHVTNTATQIQIMQALGGTVPTFAHHSLLTGPQGEALSKRLGVLALRDLRADVGDATVLMADTCLDEFTDHGHCGVVDASGRVDNDATNDRYVELAVAQAESGAHVVSPSGMMDGQVAAIRDGLDAAGFTDIAILAYAAKFASGFYGPFREAVASSLEGDRRTYQQEPGNAREAVHEVDLDIEEGADLVMVKPAMAYLDIVRAAADISPVPVAAYQVSGEYAMISAAAANGWIDLRTVALESLTGIRRAGADIVLTYWAAEAARWLS